MWPWHVKMATQNLLKLLLLLMLMMRIVLATVCCRFGRWGLVTKLYLCWLSAQGLVKSLKLKFRRDFEAEVWSVFCCWCLVEVTKLNLCEDYEASFGQDFKFKFSWDALSRFQNWSLIKICVELVIWTHPSGPLCLWQCLRIIFEPSRLPPVTLLTPFWKSHWVFVA